MDVKQRRFVNASFCSSRRPSGCDQAGGEGGLREGKPGRLDEGREARGLKGWRAGRRERRGEQGMRAALLVGGS